MSCLNREGLAAWVERSCAAQGVPVKITDPVLIEQVRVLLTGQAGRAAPPARRGTGKARRARRDSKPEGASEPPDGGDAFGAEHAGSGRAGPDDGVVQNGADDRGLTGQVQIRPRSA